VPLTRPASSRFADLPGLRMHYLDWDGEAPPLLLLHPNRTNSRVWDFVVDALALPNRVLAPDQRGHGLSDYPESGYGYADYLADTEALLESLGIAEVHLVGAATGGNLALLLASRRPGLVRTLVVVDPGLSLDPGINRRVQAQIAHEFRFASLEEARARMPFSERWSEEMKDHYSRHSLRPLEDGSVEWRYHRPGVAETEELLEQPIWDRIGVRCPTLRGSGSAVFPPENAATLASLVPGSTTLELEADHRVSQDNPGGLAAAIDAFLSDPP
jgi:pimeloyl-ACP methyl ester carboxylesterase